MSCAALRITSSGPEIADFPASRHRICHAKGKNSENDDHQSAGHDSERAPATFHPACSPEPDGRHQHRLGIDLPALPQEYEPRGADRHQKPAGRAAAHSRSSPRPPTGTRCSTGATQHVLSDRGLCASGGALPGIGRAGRMAPARFADRMVSRPAQTGRHAAQPCVPDRLGRHLPADGNFGRCGASSWASTSCGAFFSSSAAVRCWV